MKLDRFHDVGEVNIPLTKCNQIITCMCAFRQVCCVSRLVPQKGVHLLRAAIFHTLNRGGQFILQGTSQLPDIKVWSWWTLSTAGTGALHLSSSFQTKDSWCSYLMSCQIGDCRNVCHLILHTSTKIITHERHECHSPLARDWSRVFICRRNLTSLQSSLRTILMSGLSWDARRPSHATFSRELTCS